MDKYVNKLRLFCGSDFRYKLEGNHLIVFVDSESLYDYVFCNHIIVYSERNRKREVGHWDKRELSDYCFAQLIRSAMGEGIVYEDTSRCEEAETLDELNILMSNRFSKGLFSVGKVGEDKISLRKTDNGYQIEYSDVSNRHIIESGDDKKFIFARFFNEVLYYEYFRNSIEKYQNVYGIHFLKEEIIMLIGF